MPDLPRDLPTQVEAALAEDIGAGDVTAALVPAAQRVRGRVITREPAVLCGRAWAQETFRRLDPAVRLSWNADDGERLSADQVVFEIAGPARPVLTGERTALNFLQRPDVADRGLPPRSQALRARSRHARDPPGLRTARNTRCGGAGNNRMGLFDRVLIKETTSSPPARYPGHPGGAAPKSGTPGGSPVLHELTEALNASADIVMLDEFSPRPAPRWC
jgi:nicotinate-nucleotide pyrophosphorylase (carboxylating)